MIFEETRAARHADADRSAGAAGRGRAAGVPGDPRAVQARHRGEPRVRRLPGPLRSRRRVQGDGAARRGDRRVPEGAARARRAGCARRRRSASAFFEKGQFAVSETVLRRAVDGVDGGRRGQDRPDLLAGPRAGGAGQGDRTPSPATSARWPWTSGSWISASASTDSPRDGANELSDRADHPGRPAAAGARPAGAGAARAAPDRRGRLRAHRRGQLAPVPDAGQDVPAHAAAPGRRGDRRPRSARPSPSRRWSS